MATKRLPHPDPVEEAKRERKRAAHRAWSARNRERINARTQARYWADIDATHAKSKRAYQANRPSRDAANKRWHAKHPEKTAIYAARWYARAKAKDPEAFLANIRAKGRVQRAKHGAKYVEQHKEWAHANLAIINAASRRRRARKRAVLINDFTAQGWRALCKAAGYRCVYCGKKFPFKALEPDHLTPVGPEGPHTLHNILPACGPCNRQKGDRAVLRPVQPFLLVEEDSAAD